MKNLISAFSLLFLLVIGCNKETATGPEDTTGAQAKTSQAYTSLEEQFTFWTNNTFTNASSYDRLNFQTANSLYKEAITLDPNNSEAQFGAAITELLVAYSDPQIKDIVKRWESSANSNSLSKALFNGGFPSSAGRLLPPMLTAAENSISLYKIAMTDPPLLSEMQAVLRDKLLPRIVYGIERLGRVEQDTAFRFRISGKMQGDPKLTPVNLYVTEIYMIDAVWQGIRFLLEEFLMYRYDMPDYTQASVVNALSQSNTDFFVLASDGLTRGQNAKSSLDAVFTKIQTGLTTLTTISGNRSDAVIKLGNIGLRQPDIDSLRSYLQQARNALTTPFTVHLTDWDSQGNSYTVQVFLGALFNNPPQNPKSAFFPPYTVTPSGTSGISLQFSANTYNEFVFPDPTFNGLFPGMTNDALKRILFIDEAYGYTLDGYAYTEGYYNPVTGTIKLQTASATYTTQTDQWGDFRLIITDASNVPYRLFLNTGSGDQELSGEASFTVRAKTHEWVNIILTPQPTNLVAVAFSNSARVQLSWLPTNYASYKVQRGVGNGSTPTDFDSSYAYGGQFTDYSVASGTTYTYRIRTWTPAQPYYSYYGQLRLKNPLFSSVVTITP
jgi:hypothetical protein